MREILFVRKMCANIFRVLLLPATPHHSAFIFQKINTFINKDEKEKRIKIRCN